MPTATPWTGFFQNDQSKDKSLQQFLAAYTYQIELARDRVAHPLYSAVSDVRSQIESAHKEFEIIKKKSREMTPVARANYLGDSLGRFLSAVEFSITHKSARLISSVETKIILELARYIVKDIKEVGGTSSVIADVRTKIDGTLQLKGSSLTIGQKELLKEISAIMI